MKSEIVNLLYKINKTAKSTKGREQRQMWYQYKNTICEWLIDSDVLKLEGCHFFADANKYMNYYSCDGYGFHFGRMELTAPSNVISTIDGLISENKECVIDKDDGFLKFIVNASMAYRCKKYSNATYNALKSYGYIY